MSSQLHITANFDKHPRIKPKDHAEAYDALKKEIDHIKDQNNLFKKQVNQGSQVATGSTVTFISRGGATGGGGAVSNEKPYDIRTQALLSGVPTVITFDYPAILAYLPDCYAVQDGMFTFPIGYTITFNDPIGFTITASADCTMKYAYQSL